jgi:hypothetical protein
MFNDGSQGEFPDIPDANVGDCASGLASKSSFSVASLYQKGIPSDP